MRGLPGSPTTIESGSPDSGEDSFGELELLVNRKYLCPICDTSFTSKDVRSDKAISDGMDMDLRPRYKNVDPTKYRVIMCPACGYADMSVCYGKLNKKELEALKKRNVENGGSGESEVFARSYPEAYRYYKAAMRCDLLREAKSSHRVYTTINAAWLLRGWRESLEKTGSIVSDEDEMSYKEEQKLIKYALKNLKQAEEKEDFPANNNNMSEAAFNYLMAALCFDQGEIDLAGKYVLKSLQDKTLKPALRTKAEDLRDMIREKRRK